MTNIDPSTPQLIVIKKWIDTICSLDTSKLAPLSARNFTYKSFPNAIDMPEVREQGKEAHIQWIQGVNVSIKNFEVNIHEVIEAPGKVVTHATAVATMIDGTTHEYDSVSIFTLVEEDGETKVLESKDFADPQKRSAFYAAISKAAAQVTAAS